MLLFLISSLVFVAFAPSRLLLFYHRHFHRYDYLRSSWPPPNSTALRAYGVSDLHRKEQADLADLLHKCHYGDELLISRNASVPFALAKQAFLDSCFPIEISTSQGGRSMGHCTDYLQYVYFAGARLSPQFDADVYQEHVRKCPNSIRFFLLFFYSLFSSLYSLLIYHYTLSLFYIIILSFLYTLFFYSISSSIYLFLSSSLSLLSQL